MSSIPEAEGDAPSETNRVLNQLLTATKTSAAASLAAGMIAASGRPHSVQEALELVHSIKFALYPTPNNDAYKQWAKEKALHLVKVHD